MKKFSWSSNCSPAQLPYQQWYVQCWPWHTQCRPQQGFFSLGGAWGAPRADPPKHEKTLTQNDFWAMGNKKNLKNRSRKLATLPPPPRVENCTFFNPSLTLKRTKKCLFFTQEGCHGDHIVRLVNLPQIMVRHLYIVAPWVVWSVDHKTDN